MRQLETRKQSSYDENMDVEYNWEIEGYLDRPVASGPVPEQPAGRRWPYVLALLGVLIVAAMLTWYQVNALRIEAEVVAIREVERNFDLALTAITEDDEEVFPLVLPGSELNWTTVQRRLFRDSALFARAPFGLLQTSAGQEIVNTELSPDLAQAVVLSTQTYEIVPPMEPAGAQPAKPVTLQFTTLLEKEGGQWSWQAPNDSFWGARQTIETGRLIIDYPQRDAELIQRLAADLDAEVDHICAQLAMIACPEGPVLTLQMSVDPAVFMPPPETSFMRGEQEELIVPAPTLMGLSVDEAGYQAVRRGYAAHVAAAMVKNIIGWECSNPITLYLAAQEGRLVC
jgi:hypothetical protein